MSELEELTKGAPKARTERSPPRRPKSPHGGVSPRAGIVPDMQYAQVPTSLLPMSQASTVRSAPGSVSAGSLSFYTVRGTGELSPPQSGMSGGGGGAAAGPAAGLSPRASNPHDDSD